MAVVVQTVCIKKCMKNLQIVHLIDLSIIKLHVYFPLVTSLKPPAKL